MFSCFFWNMRAHWDHCLGPEETNIQTNKQKRKKKRWWWGGSWHSCYSFHKRFSGTLDHLQMKHMRYKNIGGFLQEPWSFPSSWYRDFYLLGFAVFNSDPRENQEQWKSKNELHTRVCAHKHSQQVKALTHTFYHICHTPSVLPMLHPAKQAKN